MAVRSNSKRQYSVVRSASPVSVTSASCITVGHLLFTGAMRTSDASAVMPYDFARLPFSALLGFWLFAQKVDIWTWIGAAVIFAAGAYITHREVRLGREHASRQDAS